MYSESKTPPIGSRAGALMREPMTGKIREATLKTTSFSASKKAGNKSAWGIDLTAASLLTLSYSSNAAASTLAVEQPHDRLYADGGHHEYYTNEGQVCVSTSFASTRANDCAKSLNRLDQNLAEGGDHQNAENNDTERFEASFANGVLGNRVPRAVCNGF